jgi:hypothetical protein
LVVLTAPRGVFVTVRPNCPADAGHNVHKDQDAPLPRPKRERRRARADRGLPPDQELRQLATEYLRLQRKHWPKLAKAGLLPDAKDDVVAAMVEDFKHRHRTGLVDPAPLRSLLKHCPKLAGHFNRYSCAERLATRDDPVCPAWPCRLPAAGYRGPAPDQIDFRSASSLVSPLPRTRGRGGGGEGDGPSRFTRPVNGFLHGIEIVINLGVPEAQHQPALRLQVAGSTGIIGFSSKMRLAIQLDNDHAFMTGKERGRRAAGFRLWATVIGWASRRDRCRRADGWR